jgi:hypothetical protein
VVSAPLATDPDEIIGRLQAALEAKDVDAALDAANDLIDWSRGMPGTSQRLREILESARA